MFVGIHIRLIPHIHFESLFYFVLDKHIQIESTIHFHRNCFLCEIFNIDCYSETDYYVLNAEIDPKEKKIVYSLAAEYYNNQAETYERKLENPELEDYFKTTGVEIIEARYSGGGDSGDIDTITIDGEDSNIRWGTQYDDDKLIWDTLYDNLESAYGGWEIDDGSAGTIELNNNLEIVISHEWNMREMETCKDRYVITENDIEEE